jgi:formylglycine-generating enzyme required for sulfatase activity
MIRHVGRALALASALPLAACGGGGGGGGGSSGTPPADTTPPSIEISLAPRAVLGGGSLLATITFSEAITGFSIGDVTLGGGTPGAFTAVDARTYTLAITADGAGATTVDLDIAAGACADAAGNQNGAAAGQAAIAYAPWASSTGSDAAGAWADLSLGGAPDGPAVQRFRLIPPGAFYMGSPADEPGRSGASETRHQVTLTTPYWLADTECSQRLWKIVTGGTPSWHTAGGLDLPVEQVSWNAVQGFLTTLNGSVAGLDARLPTESEWEHAARAGTTTPFGISPATAATINCYVDGDDPYISSGTYRAETVQVASLPANAWGIRGMHGNVWEWCSDRWQDDWGSTSVTDPTGPAGGTTNRVERGGGWNDPGQSCRSATRSWDDPAFAISYVGFRLAVPGRPSGGG